MSRNVAPNEPEIPISDAAAVQAAVDRIVAAPAFARQGRAAQLLRYVVAETLAGREIEIKESVIAHEVLGREEYDPKVDSLVRVEIGKLRSRLARYYEEDGAAEAIRIEIPKRSYVPTITTRVPNAEAANDRRTPWARRGLAATMLGILAAVGAWLWMSQNERTGLAGPPSVAVLPFADVSQDGALRAYCEGLTDAVTNALASGDYLRVVARSSAARFRGREVDVRRVGRELDVQAVLEGSLQKSQNGIEATLRLVNAKDGFHLWTNTFQVDSIDTADAQQEIARRVESAFRFQLTGATRGLARPGTRNADAWHYYLRGAQLSTSGEPERAAESYRAAVAADAKYALAWAGLAESLVTLAEWGVESGAVLDRAADAASRAVSLDARSPGVQQAFAQVKVLRDRDWHAAETALRKAIMLDPTDVNLRYDLARLVLTPQARFDEAIAELRRALALHPRGNHLLNALAYTYVREGRFQDAAPVVARSLAIAPDAPGAHVLRGMIVSSDSGPHAALPSFRKAVSIRANAWTLAALGVALARSGNAQEAELLISQIGDPYHRAALLLALHRKPEALNALESAYEAYSPSLPWIAVDADFRQLRGDSQFEAIVRKMRLSPP